jgi:hypothetical protein
MQPSCPTRRLPAVGFEFLLQEEGLLAQDKSTIEVPEMGSVPPNLVERDGVKTGIIQSSDSSRTRSVIALCTGQPGQLIKLDVERERALKLPECVFIEAEAHTQHPVTALCIGLGLL